MYDAPGINPSPSVSPGPWTVRPGGRIPDSTLKAYGGVPPDAVSADEAMLPNTKKEFAIGAFNWSTVPLTVRPNVSVAVVEPLRVTERAKTPLVAGVPEI